MQGLKRAHSDLSDYSKDDEFYIAFYVDDLFLMGKGERAEKSVISYLCSVFEVTVLVPVKFLLGVHIDKNRKEGWNLIETKQVLF
ncbi:hypothetical protein MPTK1_3g01830 [Marchantia polymorpha subsp. ruderalis]|uniref:Reverse transcriptase Ty1/copia-type domain-containing protein n=1 Tax=Marchantia polymorpha subsp. ruderalis TaxID=1480154 RepID=A0AAF6AWF7_MARPO|nr:hypothetical protein Mp_3g01830 [Marchantia polymorpha subsp. ruderalis]